MSPRPLAVLFAAGAAIVSLAGCGSTEAAGNPAPVAAGLASATPGATATPAATATTVVPASNPAATPAAPAASAPTKLFAVGSRQLNLSRGVDRPLRTVVWYPISGTAGGAVKKNATPAPGRFPLVLFSHGLTSSPEGMHGVTTKLAAAGFVVAAPAYPFTSNGAASFNPGDMSNQPADASVVITEVLKLDAKAGDPFAGHIDATRVGAAGHSAGGFTTAGLLSGKTRDTRLKAGVIISGGAMGGPFSGAPTPILFIHGDKDAVVSYATGRSAFDKLTWPKAFVTIIGGDHVAPVTNTASLKTMIDFLRSTLYGDKQAKSRLPADATVAAKSRYESSSL